MHNYATCVKHVSFFYTAADELLSEMCARVIAVQLTDGLSAFNARDAATEVFVVIKGEIEILEGEFHTVHVGLLPGALFGEGAMFQEGRRKARSEENARRCFLCALRSCVRARGWFCIPGAAMTDV